MTNMTPAKLYRPSNGTEGMIFQELYCDNCKHDRYTEEHPENGCQILRATLLYRREDSRYPQDWVWNPDKCLTRGLDFNSPYGPRCTSFEERT